MDRFYFAGYLGKRVEELHLHDLACREDVTFVSESLIPMREREKRLFEKAHQWKRIEDKEPLFKSYWNHFYTLYNLEYSREDNHYIIFFDSAISVCYSEEFFRKLKKKNPNIKLIMYLVDQMDRWYSGRIRRMLPLFDLVYAINHEDCETYGFRYYPLLYSNYPLSKVKKLEEQSDIYFIGNNWDRDEYLHKLYDMLTSKGVKCDFNIVGVDEEKQLYKDKICYNRPFSMAENLAHSMASKCVLEIMHQTIHAVTARYPEAVYLNRKLLTNNPAVRFEKYYNPDYIKVFHSLEDIDIDWIKEDVQVDYHYDNGFSPALFIEEIKRTLG